MVSDPFDLASKVSLALAPQFRQNLLTRGQAQSMMRRNGRLPVDAPRFDSHIDEDLLGYAYALLASSLRIMDSADMDAEPPVGSLEIARRGCFQASLAIEAATRNAPDTEMFAFHRLMAGAASHLGNYAARAFSLVRSSQGTARLTAMEAVFADLVMRGLDQAEARAKRFRTSPRVLDEALIAMLRSETRAGTADADLPGWSTIADHDGEPAGGPYQVLVEDNYMAAVATGLFAIGQGRRRLLDECLDDLALGQQASLEIAAPGPWWIQRVTRRILGDLAETSIRSHIPSALPGESAGLADGEPQARWRYLRRTFVDSLLARDRSEIDLWPSQLHIVDRVFAGNGDLVVALPTSSGKTRVAELCILACLGRGQRVVYVTPLRALSAQTEQTLIRTFVPLGVRVSSLYGSMGVSVADEDALRENEIVVATPEKLDFALRSDPTLLDDVGLVVLDEGHMIGPTEREVRYESQIQRLIRRDDASLRRIVCLSAVFPSGEDLDDFVAWLTGDAPEGLHREEWRPTQQRFGLVEWQGDHARLAITVGEEQPFISHYVEARTPTGRRRKVFPSDARELVIATAWKLLEEGQTVLVFCPERRSVEPYAKAIVTLHRQGLIDSVLPVGADISAAISAGSEWFEDDHPVLEALRLGVAVHHGALPGPFRREIESLLQAGIIRVTVASPTLAQGLNLSASVVLFHGLRRNRELLSPSEFSNVIGRAGRAFVDTEGLVLYPVFEPSAWRRSEWRSLAEGGSGKALSSGLIEVSEVLIRRVLAAIGRPDIDRFLQYVSGSDAWSVPAVQEEVPAEARVAAEAWRTNLALLDTAILSIVGEEGTDPGQTGPAITEALAESLWERQLARSDASSRAACRAVIERRAEHLWSLSTPAQRRGWYLAGLGLAAGESLAQVSERVVALTALAEESIVAGRSEAAICALVEIAEILFGLERFAAETPLVNWAAVFRGWLLGLSLSEIPVDSVQDRLVIAQFIESDLTYRLVWGMEAARVYESAQGNGLADSIAGSAIAAVETGTLIPAASLLIQAGFDRRSAAILAVLQTGARFDSREGLREWIRGLDPDLTAQASWPTPDSHSAWEEFMRGAVGVRLARWEPQIFRVEAVEWRADPVPSMRVTIADSGEVGLWSPGFDHIADLSLRLNPSRVGVLHARPAVGGTAVDLLYNGPRDLVRAL